MGNTYKILIGRVEGDRLPERPRRRWWENVELGLKEIAWVCEDRIHAALVKRVINIWVP
jgi:hypothetical protein